MHNIWALFVDDMKSLFSNTVTIIILLGLVFLPSIFSWYNIDASWDVFNNTGNIKVAVANTDEGYESDLVPLEVNIGDRVVSSLRENDQINWVFTSEDDAIDGTSSGRYYAAVVIPPSFSKDMMTFYSDDVEHAQIVYYTNEKKSAVAPKVTDQSANQVSYQVNVAFSETLSELSLALSSSLSQYADASGMDSRLGDLAKHVSSLSDQMKQASVVLSAYAKLLDTSQSLVEGSARLLGQAKDSASEVTNAASDSKEGMGTVALAMSDSASALADALEKSSASYEGLGESIDQAFASSDTLAKDSTEQLRSQAEVAHNQAADFATIVDLLEQLKPTAAPQYQDAIQAMIDQLNTSIELQNQLATSLDNAADSIESGNADAQAQHAEIKVLVTQAQESLEGLSADYNNDVKPAMDELATSVTAITATLESNAQQLGGVADELQGSSGSLSAQLGTTKQQLSAAASDLEASSGRMAQLSASLTEALESSNLDEIKTLLSADPEVLSVALSAPVELERTAVFPADNFGSQMAPLYTTLALWIGSLLLVVAIKVHVSKKSRRAMDNPKLYQMFLGRFGVFAVVSFMQTTCMSLGNMLFMKVQVNEPLLYLLCFWLAGLVFTFIMYSLVVSFANLGKAIGVFLLIIQVTSGGGSFPLQVLPDVFQWLSPYVPATHVINGMRAAMFGVYQGDFWISMACLLLFVIPAAFLGLVLRKPLMRFLHWYIEKVEDSKLVV